MSTIKVGSHVRTIRNPRACPPSFVQTYYVERIVDRGHTPMAELFFSDKPSGPIWIAVDQLELAK